MTTFHLIFFSILIIFHYISFCFNRIIHCFIICGAVVEWLSLRYNFIQQSLIKFFIGSNAVRGVSDICGDKNLCQLSWLEIRLGVFYQSTIPQKQFIIIFIFLWTSFIILLYLYECNFFVYNQIKNLCVINILKPAFPLINQIFNIQEAPWLKKAASTYYATLEC